MKTKSLIMIFMVLGSFLGGYVPALWGGSGLSLASVLFAGLGGVLGIWTGYRVSRL